MSETSSPRERGHHARSAGADGRGDVASVVARRELREPGERATRWALEYADLTADRPRQQRATIGADRQREPGVDVRRGGDPARRAEHRSGLRRRDPERGGVARHEQGLAVRGQPGGKVHAGRHAPDLLRLAVRPAGRPQHRPRTKPRRVGVFAALCPRHENVAACGDRDVDVPGELGRDRRLRAPGPRRLPHRDPHTVLGGHRERGEATRVRDHHGAFQHPAQGHRAVGDDPAGARGRQLDAVRRPAAELPGRPVARTQFATPLSGRNGSSPNGAAEAAGATAASSSAATAATRLTPAPARPSCRACGRP